MKRVQFDAFEIWRCPESAHKIKLNVKREIMNRLVYNEYESLKWKVFSILEGICL